MGKTRILGSRSPLTPWPIDLIFDMGDYVGDMTPQAKNGKNRPRIAGVKYEGQILGRIAKAVAFKFVPTRVALKDF